MPRRVLQSGNALRKLIQILCLAGYASKRFKEFEAASPNTAACVGACQVMLSTLLNSSERKPSSAINEYGASTGHIGGEIMEESAA